MKAQLFDLIEIADTVIVDDYVIDTVGYSDNFMPGPPRMLARLTFDDTDYHFEDQEVEVVNGYGQAMALTWDDEGEELATEEVKVSMAFRVEVMLDEQHMSVEVASTPHAMKVHQRLDSLPTVIDGPGEYLCRDGRRALIHSTNGSTGTFSCRGARYRMFRGHERARGLFIWHPSGRYWSIEESPYDIVAKAPEEVGNE